MSFPEVAEVAMQFSLQLAQANQQDLPPSQRKPAKVFDRAAENQLLALLGYLRNFGNHPLMEQQFRLTNTAGLTITDPAWFTESHSEQIRSSARRHDGNYIRVHFWPYRLTLWDPRQSLDRLQAAQLTAVGGTLFEFLSPLVWSNHGLRVEASLVLRRQGTSAAVSADTRFRERIGRFGFRLAYPDRPDPAEAPLPPPFQGRELTAEANRLLQKKAQQEIPPRQEAEVLILPVTRIEPDKRQRVPLKEQRTGNVVWLAPR